MNECQCVYCRKIKPIPEPDYINCAICGDFLFYDWSKYPHGYRSFSTGELHRNHEKEGYSHGQKLGKIWI